MLVEVEVEMKGFCIWRRWGDWDFVGGAAGGSNLTAGWATEHEPPGSGCIDKDWVVSDVLFGRAQWDGRPRRFYCAKVRHPCPEAHISYGYLGTDPDSLEDRQKGCQENDLETKPTNICSLWNCTCREGIFTVCIINLIELWSEPIVRTLGLVRMNLFKFLLLTHQAT